LVVPAHVLAESKYEFRHPIAGLKPAGAGGKPAPIMQGSTPEERTGVMSTGQILASDGGVDWYGEVSAEKLIDGIALAKLIGLTAGTAQYSDAGWLHVGLDDQELLIAKRPLQHSLNWNHLNAVKAVYGNLTVEINGQMYKVRLLKGANSDPTVYAYGYDVTSSHGSEWNRIFYRLTNNTYTVASNRKTSEQPFVHLAQYSEADLILDYRFGKGSYNWCQELTTGGDRLVRGFYGVSHSNKPIDGLGDSYYGWRPVLEKV
jgi:hypothetical protein